MAALRVRYKSPRGNGVMTFDETATVENLALQLYCETGTQDFQVRYGWPPRPLDLKASKATLSSLKMNGETLTVVMEQPPEPEPKPDNTKVQIARNEKSPEPGNIAIPWPDRKGALVLRVMPDDNSCLFTAFGGVFQKADASAALRQEVASAILSNPETYTEVVLEMPPDRYCSTILHPDRWGGAIELGILSELYNIEICSVDVKTGRIDRYGEGMEKRCILCYSGIHYDRIAFSFCSPPYTNTNMPVTVDLTTWGTDDDEVLEKTVELSEKLKGMNYYTDTAHFVLKCEAPGCHWIGEGASQAQKHMTATGHTTLSEMEIT